MVHIIVDNHDPLKSIVVERVLCGDCDIIEEAKAHCLVRQGMMTWWTHQAIGIVDLATHHRVNCCERSSRCFNGCCIRLGRDVGVGGEKVREMTSVHLCDCHFICRSSYL